THFEGGGTRRRLAIGPRPKSKALLPKESGPRTGLRRPAASAPRRSSRRRRRPCRPQRRREEKRLPTSSLPNRGDPPHGPPRPTAPARLTRTPNLGTD